ncbi:sulfotransferase [Sphingobium sp. AS12]|uniref:tetratricopeptide repeat-containing sulfotransferase family protein n=1 Tax=Sphingobium sp. AS12 TaxID=2849495 RepID=UPI001C3173FB|nr:sulfotransferase [Sphingobium sp. AS12]MBV2150043.1 sulfotransferase [Sphingobium sp. AS12]
MLDSSIASELLHRPAIEPCACGSSLAFIHCCGLGGGEVRTELPEQDQALAGGLEDAKARRDREATREAALAILGISPGHKDALQALYDVLQHEQKWDAASAVIDRLARIHFNDAVSRMIAAQYFLARGDMLRAQFHARMLVRLAPEALISHLTMGRAFLAQHNGKAAEHHFRIGLALPAPRGPDVPRRDIEAHLAIALRDQGRFDEARALFEVLAEDTKEPTLLLAWAKLEESDRKVEVALQLLERAEALAPDHPQLPIARATLFRRTHEHDRALALLDASVGEDGASSGLLEKGQILDSMGRYDEAFATFTALKARLCETSGHSYQAERAASLVKDLREFFTEGRSRLLPRASLRSDHPQPIFIVGFPRSGTTLIEQTLSAHPDIAAGDELPIIGQLAERAQNLLGSLLTYPKALSEMWLGDRAGHVDSLRDLYLNEAVRFGAVDPAKRWFTDKMPLNETHLGLIHILFPQSPIVHLVRHPLDVVLSVFSNGLTHGFHCAYALESAARHYALIAELIAHYHTALPLNYRAVRYEELVADQEGEVRSLLDFLGVPFVPATLAFHENARYARTASYAQVTEPIYTRSVHRYRNYLKHLEPVIPILMPAIQRLGYAIETDRHSAPSDDRIKSKAKLIAPDCSGATK